MTTPPDPNDDIDDVHAIDEMRSVGLADVGSSDYLAATVVTASGETRFALARIDKLGDWYDSACPNAPHEAGGPLPLEYVRRITKSQRLRRREAP